jgi:hypothetical protein
MRSNPSSDRRGSPLSGERPFILASILIKLSSARLRFSTSLRAVRGQALTF